MIEAYFIHIAILIFIYMILAVSLDLALGYTGLLNLGHVAFYGIGAYTSALLTLQGVPFIFAFTASGLIALLFGFILIFGTHKIKGDYLALATLGFAYVVYSILLNWAELTGGPLGVPGISKPDIFGFVINSNTEYLAFTAIIALISLFVMYKMIRSPFGRLMEAVRDDETGLKALGKNTFKIKCKAMMTSAFFAGIAGSLFAHYITYIDPSSFLLGEIVLLLTIVLIGGIASFKGQISATIIILAIPELLRFIEIPASALGPLRQIFYTLILLLILMLRPKGLFGKIDLTD